MNMDFQRVRLGQIRWDTPGKLQSTLLSLQIDLGAVSSSLPPLSLVSPPFQPLAPVVAHVRAGPPAARTSSVA